MDSFVGVRTVRAELTVGVTFAFQICNAMRTGLELEPTPKQKAEKAALHCEEKVPAYAYMMPCKHSM